jgi:16S rRNA (guanine527-N7)-methyltransferase
VSSDERLRQWLEALTKTPGLTAISLAAAWDEFVDDAWAALPYVVDGPVIDVGSGTGSPGIPVAAAKPDLSVTLLEASARKCRFLEQIAGLFPNVGVVCARAEEHARSAGRDAYAVALARALAPQAVAVEWCLPLVRFGGTLIVFAGRPEPNLGRVAEQLCAEGPTVVAVAGTRSRTLLVFRKLGATPERFPRRVGMARKRPLA